jgi:hypothetical protein
LRDIPRIPKAKIKIKNQLKETIRCPLTLVVQLARHASYSWEMPRKAK